MGCVASSLSDPTSNAELEEKTPSQFQGSAQTTDTRSAEPLRCTATRPAESRAAAHDTRPWLYVLQCSDKTWYVGVTADVMQRMLDHGRGAGAAWTKLHTPQRVECTVRCVWPTDEDAMVKQYMVQYGIENVRGGAYSACVLTPAQQACLEAEMRGATGACFKCGDVDHYTSQCSHQRRPVCTRCGRNTHSAFKCYARTTLRGDPLQPNSGSASSSAATMQRTSASENADQSMPLYIQRPDEALAPVRVDMTG